MSEQVVCCGEIVALEIVARAIKRSVGSQKKAHSNRGLSVAGTHLPLDIDGHHRYSGIDGSDHLQ